MEQKSTFGVISTIKVIIEDEKGQQKILLEEKKDDYIPDCFSIEYRMNSGVRRKFEFGSFKSRLGRTGEIGFNLYFWGQRKSPDKLEKEPLEE